jgi:hypothetical protein
VLHIHLPYKNLCRMPSISGIGSILEVASCCIRIFHGHFLHLPTVSFSPAAVVIQFALPPALNAANAVPPGCPRRHVASRSPVTECFWAPGCVNFERNLQGENDPSLIPKNPHVMKRIHNHKSSKKNMQNISNIIQNISFKIIYPMV